MRSWLPSHIDSLCLPLWTERYAVGLPQWSELWVGNFPTLTTALMAAYNAKLQVHPKDR